ncbi:MAG: hypothetical protein AAFX93_10905 [Verrucomicrobiota bacterium]
MKRIHIFLLALAALIGFTASGCSSADTDEHGVVRSSEGWF